MLRSLGLMATGLFWIVSPAVGQTPRRDSIPTYLPVWQRTEDLNDYVSPKRTVRLSVPDVPTDLSLVRKSVVLNLFTFPSDSATYLMNGHRDSSRVGAGLAAPKKQPNNRSTGKPGKEAKRSIRLRRN